MEPKTKANLAPDTLTTEMDEAEIKNGLQTMLQKFKNVRGINNHMGSQFTEDKRRMNYVMDVLHDNNLFFWIPRRRLNRSAAALPAKNGWLMRTVTFFWITKTGSTM